MFTWGTWYEEQNERNLPDTFWRAEGFAGVLRPHCSPGEETLICRVAVWVRDMTSARPGRRPPKPGWPLPRSMTVGRPLFISRPHFPISKIASKIAFKPHNQWFQHHPTPEKRRSPGHDGLKKDTECGGGRAPGKVLSCMHRRERKRSDGPREKRARRGQRHRQIRFKILPGMACRW